MATVDAVHRAIIGTDAHTTDDRDYAARHFPQHLPENALTFDNVDAMRRAVESSGSHYFDADAVRFFRARTDKRMHGRRFWVESRKYVSADGVADLRTYHVAWVADSGVPGAMLSVEKAGHYLTLDYARRACASLAGAVESEKAASEKATPRGPEHVDYPHNPGCLHDCPACEASCHCDPAAVAVGRQTECVFEGEHTSPPAWLLWGGGVNYSEGYVADDTEAFPTAAAAIEACADRYDNRDGTTPSVSDDALSFLYLRDPREEHDPYPDAVIGRDTDGDWTATPA